MIIWLASRWNTISLLCRVAWMFIWHRVQQEHLFRICYTGPRYVLPVSDVVHIYLCKISGQHPQTARCRVLQAPVTVQLIFLESAITRADFLYSLLVCMSSVPAVWAWFPHVPTEFWSLDYSTLPSLGTAYISSSGTSPVLTELYASWYRLFQKDLTLHLACGPFQSMEFYSEQIKY